MGGNIHWKEYVVVQNRANKYPTSHLSKRLSSLLLNHYEAVIQLQIGTSSIKKQ